MKRILIFLLGLAAFAPLGAEQVVRIGNVICNSGTTLTVPLEVAGVTNAASVYAQVTYDPLVLVLMKADAGSLKTNFVEFVTTDAAGSVKILAHGTNNVARLTGTLANLTFAVRPGSEGLYSDLALAKVSINEKTMTVDLTVGNPLVPQRGMLRSYATDAAPMRMDAGVVTVAAGTMLKSLELKDGDALQVASSDQTPIVVTDTLAASGEVKVLPPANGWATATYNVLKSKNANLALSVVGSANATVKTTTDGDYTVYSVESVVERLLQIQKDGLKLSADKENRLIDLLRLNASIAGKLLVKGTQKAVDLGLDLGIEPEVTEEDGARVAHFELPIIEIVAFDPSAGTVRAKVIPPPGAKIAKKDMVTTGVIHVYGTSSLSEKMQKISDITLNLDDYTTSGKEGEMTLTVQFGENTFFKVVAGQATATE